LTSTLGRLGFELPPLFGHANETAEENTINRYLWRRESFDVHRDVCKECLLKMELPLIGEQGQSFGSIWLVKDLCRNAINQNTLRRVEHLRRTVLGALQELMVIQNTRPEFKRS
jgi:UDP-GlcNAc:undecaprenyl-phosphate/decaprenyl-phosphate GlcNAc-1-phosphate transferase